MQIVEYWPKGYADASGLSRITIADDQDPVTEVRRVSNSWATIASVRPVRTEPVEQFDPAYIRMMSQGG
jgi:hypothetical protein